jgi:hypothetical protein
MTPTQTPGTLPRGRPQWTEETEPLAGLWSYRLGLVLAVTVLVLIVPATLAIGLRWLSWEQAQTLAPLWNRLAVAFWVVSLFGLALSFIGLSQFGGKTRTLRGLILHLLFSVGPIFAALLLRL